MGRIILPKLDNIQVVSMSVTLGRHEVYGYTDKFTGEKVQAFLPELSPFGKSFTRYSTDAKSFDFSQAREVQENLERYLQQAFDNEAEFTKDSMLTLAVASGPRMDYCTQPQIFLGDGFAPQSAESRIYTRPAQLYKIKRNITNLE